METVAALLADPKFDVELFIHNVNLHQSRKIMSALMGDPHVVLSIAESDDWKVIERNPPTAEQFALLSNVSAAAFEKKTQAGNIWYGMKIDDKLALSYRRVDWRPEVKVHKGKSAVNAAVKRWKRLNLHRIGSNKPIKKRLEPGERPVDLVRVEVMNLLRGCGLKDYHRIDGTDSWFNYYSHHAGNISFRIIGRGSKGCKVISHKKKPGGKYWETVSTEKIFSFDNKDKKISAKEIVDWLISVDLMLAKHFPNKSKV